VELLEVRSRNFGRLFIDRSTGLLDKLKKVLTYGRRRVSGRMKRDGGLGGLLKESSAGLFDIGAEFK
jgi:hypothetical protein